MQGTSGIQGKKGKKNLSRRNRFNPTSETNLVRVLCLGACGGIKAPVFEEGQDPAKSRTGLKAGCRGAAGGPKKEWPGSKKGGGGSPSKYWMD